jgi:hypothetical protein
MSEARWLSMGDPRDFRMGDVVDLGGIAHRVVGIDPWSRRLKLARHYPNPCRPWWARLKFWRYIWG